MMILHTVHFRIINGFKRFCFAGRYFLLLIFSILFVTLTSTANAKGERLGWYNILSFGAVNHKDSSSTKAIQQAIDACHFAGGGTVYFPAGVYTSGQLYLRSNVSFYFEVNATLFASRNPGHYKKRSGEYKADNQAALPNEQALFYGDSIHHVGFFGKGRIHGQAERKWEPLKEVDMFIEKETENAKRSGIPMERFYAMEPKVRLVYINNASYITFRDMTLEESPDWTLHLGNTDNAVIDGVTILSSLDAGVNADGIDIDGCRNVRISNCTVITGDDAICLKSTVRNGRYYNCEDIVVNNCILTSTSTGLKIGTESHGDFRNIIFSNSVIRNSNRGISIVVRDGATVENILFTNLFIECNRKHFNWWGDGDPIRFILLKRNANSRLGNIKNVTVRNVEARGQGTSLIQGNAGQSLQGITLDNVKLTIEAESLPDKRATNMLSVHKVDGLTIRNSKFEWDTSKGTEPKWSSSLRIYQVASFQLQQVHFSNAVNGKKILTLDQVKMGMLDEVHAWQNSRSDLLEQNATQQVVVGKMITKENFDQINKK
jgi:hypothetical protein